MTAGLDRAPQAGAVRHFGRWQLLRLLGKSMATMAWLGAERDGREMMLVLPRAAPRGAEAMERWHQNVRRAARLSHPNLAAAVEVGVHEGWPFAAYEAHGRATLSERMPRKGLTGAEAAGIAVQALRALAYAHEAGVVHGDLQRHMWLVDDQGRAELVGLEVACETPPELLAGAEPGAEGVLPLNALQQQRLGAERDVLAFGLVLHGLLAGVPALEEPDIGRALARMPPLGREIVRLPWSGVQPIAEPLRAIVNRATDRQERQRYRSARTFAHALEGWLQVESAAAGGVLGLLGDKLRAAGVLPASAGAGARAARLALMEGERTNELAEVVLEDLALSFELLRLVNTAQVRGAQVSGAGPVLTVRRAIAMLGMDGVRRAALALRSWPGPLAEPAAVELAALVERCKRAARIAMALRAPYFDGEVVYLLTLLQNLGRLVVHYHFADDAQQIRRLTQPAPPAREGDPPDPGMSEESAAFAVLGADIESIGQAVARWWGLEESVLAMIRRASPAAPVHQPNSDDEALRLVASCANEAADAMAQPPQKVLPALQRVVQRYGRLLDFTLRDLQEALQNPGAERIAHTAPMPLEPADRPKGSSLRAAATRGALR
jgi:non-specific serine/threonine protein kinase